MFSRAEVIMYFAFRVDSSPKIGMGHLMRCLALANDLKKRGFECYFICRNFEGNGSQHVISNGFKLLLLSNDNVVAEDSWLGVPVEQDVKDTISVLANKPADWLIIDHYDIDQQWEAGIRSEFSNIKILVIDDLVNRRHDCDILLDQTYGRSQKEYSDLISPDAEYCLGTGYALLRSEFKELREKTAGRRKPQGDICHILVTLGGGDSRQTVQIIGEAFKKLADEHLFSATVIIGNTPDELLADYDIPSHEIECVKFSNNVASEMAKADIAIGAGGGTSWERCCLGLPTVVLTMADNQIEISKILHEKKVGISVNTNVAEISTAVKILLVDQVLRSKMRKNAADLCDGNGVARVVSKIIASSFEIEKAILSDAQFIYDARYADDASQFYRNENVPSFEEHVSWLEKALAKDDRVLVCISIKGENIAHVRLDKDFNKTDNGEIGICLAKEWRGRGIGLTVLNAANAYFAKLGFVNIDAEVHENNAASAQIFDQAGYSHVSTDNDGFMRYLWRA